jgi:hypothetical protein
MQDITTVSKPSYHDVSNTTRNHGHLTDENEDPPPPVIPSDTFHLRDTECQDASEGTRQRSSAEEQGDTELALIALVPHRQIENNA